MRYLVCSDIHGSIDSVERIIDLFKKYSCDKIICLGDILYHGPRNDLPLNYNPKACIKILNEYKDYIIAIKGNCDAEVDQMVLNFKILEDSYLSIGDNLYYLCHGHHLNFDSDDLILNNATILYGHYHIPSIKNINNRKYINVGSITLPKENSPRSYALLDDDGIKIYNLDESVVLE